MTIWSGEIKELEKLYDSVKGVIPLLAKELEQLLRTDDANVVMLYSRRCLEVIVTDLCECELKRPRKTEPLKGIIDKLNSEEKVPSHIITSMHGMNSLSTYGAHPKDFDPEQVKPVLNNLTIVIKWYLKYKESSGSGTEVDSSGIKVLTPEGPTKNEPVLPKRRISRLAAIFIICIAAGAIMATGYFMIKKSPIYDDLEKSIAVLPFRNDSPEDSTQYFMDGVMEELLNNLSKIKSLEVWGRTSVEQYRKQIKPIPEIARELGVNYIIEGSGQKSGKSFRMRIQLIAINKNKEKHIWANSFEQENLDINEYFKIQSGFAEAIANELNAALSAEERQLLEKVPTENLNAYEAYLKGQVYWRILDQKNLETALRYFELAKTIDPNYAPAYAGISFVYAALAQMGYQSPEEVGPKMMEALSKAIELDSSMAEVQYALAGINTWVLWNWEEGEAAFKKAIELKPNYPEAHAYYSHFLNMLGRSDEAMEQIQIALKLDPVNPLIMSLYGVDLRFIRKYDESLEAFYEALKIEPDYPFALGNLSVSLHFAGKYDEALSDLRKYLASFPDLVEAIDIGNKENGYKGAMLRLADKMAEQYITIYRSPLEIAQNYLIAGEKEKAMEWFEKGYEVRDQNMPYILLPELDDLRDDPRFQEIAHKMKLPYK